MIGRAYRSVEGAPFDDQPETSEWREAVEEARCDVAAPISATRQLSQIR
jgi:hypothetical protein